MQMAIPPGYGLASGKRRRAEDAAEEEKRCGRYRATVSVDTHVSSVDLPSLGCIRALAVGSDGTVFMCTESALYAATPGGKILLIAGSRSETGFRDGQGPEVRLNKPCGLALYPDGSLILADTYNHCLRRVSADGTVSTFAGCGMAGLADGSGASARFQYPWNVVVDAHGAIFVSDHGNHCIRRVTPGDGTVVTVCGSRQGEGGFADGESTAARFKQPSGLVLDMSGSLIVADSGNSCIRRVSLVDGAVMSVAGNQAGGDAGEGFADGFAADARFRYPFAVAVDRTNSIIVADGHNHRLRIISHTGEGAAVVTTLAGSSQKGAQDGALSSALFSIPWQLAMDEHGRVLVAELGNQNRVRVVVH
jgi:sugar lactone lactonase YvrE